MRRLLLGFLLIGCATEYGPSGFTGGYRDKYDGMGRYTISVDGNGFTSSQRVASIAKRRAKELCKQDEYSSYSVVTKENITRTSTMKGDDTATCVSGVDLYKRSTTACRFTPGEETTIAKPSQTLQIICRGKHYEDWFEEDLLQILEDCFQNRINTLPKKAQKDRGKLAPLYRECFCLTSYIPEYVSPSEYDKEGALQILEEHDLIEYCKNDFY